MQCQMTPLATPDAIKIAWNPCLGSVGGVCVFTSRLININSIMVQIDQMETDRPNILQEISTTTLVDGADKKKE